MSVPDEGPVYFYGHGHGHAYEVFSQFHALKFRAPAPTHESITSTTTTATATQLDNPGVPFATFAFAEQYMMYAKAILFGDADAARAILAADSPRRCKALGRSVRGFDEAVWDAHKLAVVEEGSFWKFTAGEGKHGRRARDALLATGERELVEASPHDRVWGIGFAARDAERNRARWGSNLLGRALERARARVREWQAEQDEIVKKEGMDDDSRSAEGTMSEQHLLQQLRLQQSELVQELLHQVQHHQQQHEEEQDESGERHTTVV